MVTFQVKVKNASQTPRKTGAIAALIRQQSVDDALLILQRTPKRAARIFIKLLKNAQATSNHNYRLQPSTLKIASVFVTGGRKVRKGRIPSRQNRVKHRRIIPVPYQRKSSHIFLTIQGQPPVKRSTAAAKRAQQTKKS